ncbi:hypothetical protein MKX03_028539 [Papaver bracteatum]|nr:hypothetical protein MKX03_028539 [Papaver bracteatum]
MDESSKLMESQLRKARDDAEIWRKTCWELEGHFIDLKQMEHQEVELEKQHKANIGMFNELYFQFDKKKLECFQVKKKLDALVAENGNFVYDASLKYRVQELMKQADLWVNQELRMKYCVDEYKSKYETLLLKFKEKEIECNRLKEKRKKKSASIGVVARIDVLEEEYRKMESEEREKRVRLNNMLVEPNIKPSSLRGNFEDVHVQGINNQREPSRNDTDKKKNVCPASIVESVVIPVEHHTALETEGSLGVGPVLLKQVASLPTDVIEIEDEIIEVNDSEDEKEITAAHLCSVKGKEKPHVSTDEASDPSGKYLKRRLSLQDEKCEGSSGKDILTPFSPLCSSTKKRLRVSETET